MVEKILKYLPIVEILILPLLVYLVIVVRKFSKLECNVEAIMTNHLPHMEESIKEIKEDIRQLWLILTKGC